MMRLSPGWLIVVTLVSACAASRKPTPIDTTVRIDSQPPGAFVTVDAAALGKTPLLRRMPLPPAGTSVQLTLRGYKPWSGSLSPSSAAVNATLQPLSDVEKQAAGWVTSAPIDRFAVVPVRVGTRQIGKDFQAQAPEFNKNFVSSFQHVMQTRFGQHVSAPHRSSLEGSAAVMGALEAAVKGIDMSQLSARATPLVINLPPEARAAMADIGGAVLFLRAEAYYLGGGARFARVAVPVLLTVAGAAAGASAAHATGAPVYAYNVYGPGPTQDSLVAQAFLVHSQTRELLWFGQAVAAAHYEASGVTEQVASRLAEQVPSAILLAEQAPSAVVRGE